VVAALVALLVMGGLDGWLLGGGLVLLVALLGLVRGVWLAWLFLTVVAAGDLVAALFMWPAWGTVLVNVPLLALLLLRPTRRYASRGRPRVRESFGR
jgi:hypothetical protein